MQSRDSLDTLEDKIEYLLKFVTIISELVLLLGLAYAGFKLAHKGATPEILDQIWLVSQVLALDLSAPGLFAMAARAREQQNVERAQWAIRIAIVLIIMSILTMVEGAVTSYIPNIPDDVIRYVTLAMMIIRGSAAVGYSVFRRLHKAANVAPVSVANLAVEEVAILAQLEALQQQVVQLTMQQIAPVVAPVVDMEEETCVSTEVPFIDDITAYRMRQENGAALSIEMETPRAKVTRKLSTKVSIEKGRETSRAKALRILKRTPEITASDLAQRAGITRQYASQILKQQA